jgi:hypothetical protein
MRHPKASRYATTAVLALAFVALPTIARAQSSNTIFACIKSNGSVKIVAASKACGGHETRVTWNVVGG